MIGPVTNIEKITARMCLPCTSYELAAQLGVTVRTANSMLHDLKRRGVAVPTERTVPNERINRGVKQSRLWVRV